jgi:RNA polymerase sigma-70 factor (ECF subfamily)
LPDATWRSCARASAERWDWELARARCLREAQRILGARAEAEDAVQEAFLRAWRARASCRTPEAPLPWLLQITRNEALRLLRQNGRIQDPEESAAEPAAEDAELANAAQRMDIRRALAHLSHDDRRLLELRYTDDLTQPRIASAMGLPEGTVKVRLHRLRAQLRVTLEGQL